MLPTGVCFASTTGDIDEPLFTDESRYIAGAVESRRAEFRTVRACARQALAGLGLDRPGLVPGVRGAPEWPGGVVGSMTHCPGLRAAAVARATDWAGIGIDAELNVALPPGVDTVVLRPEELAQLPVFAERAELVAWDRLIFSAKESLYKAWYPLARRWLGFDEAVISVEPAGGAFLARVNGQPLAWRGRWHACGGLLVTAVVVPPDDPIRALESASE